jgi:two-component system, NtrC family, nitrogen regulation sensor histidine kinase NtrY
VTDENRTRLPEFKKRKREIATILALCLLFLVLTWIEFKLLGISQRLPFESSIFFFGLVNFNIIIVLFLFFLIFRNVVKTFIEDQGPVIGSSLKGKLIAAFVTFASVPTALMFVISVFYINSSFDKWFSVRMGSVLKNAVEVNQDYIFSAKKKNYHFAKVIESEIRQLRVKQRTELTRKLTDLRQRLSLDAVEFYPNLFGERIVVLSKEEAIPEIPPAALEMLRKAIMQNENSSAIHHFGEGNLVRVVMPAQVSGARGAIVISSFIPFSFISRMDDISAAHDEFRGVNPLQYPLKSIYLIILGLMTLVILLCATWFGFYLARQLSIPLETLGLATRRVSDGDYRPVELLSGSSEINHLIASFNQMTANLDKSKREVLEANVNLTQTLDRLDEYSRYIQVVLSNVTTGVISIDELDKITTLNRHAEHLLDINSEAYLGRSVRESIDPAHLKTYDEMLLAMRSHGAANLQKEIIVEMRGRLIPIMISLTLLHDERGKEIGKVVVFDDLSVIVSAQRAAAWTEVARRIAHEIKNPLTPIKLSAQRLEKKFGGEIKDPAFSTCINMIIRQTDDLKRLVNEFSNFARLPQAKTTLADLNSVIRDAIELFQTSHRESGLQFEPDLTLPIFRFDPDQIGRVLINLLDNALAAVHQVETPKILVRSQYDPLLRLVRISVADNGSGIAAEYRDRVFEPYFSTKEAGTGLGLAITKRIIEDHNGFVRALENEAGGTKMIVELPVLDTDQGLSATAAVANTLSAQVKRMST